MPGTPENPELTPQLDGSTRGDTVCMDESWSASVVFRTTTCLLNNLGDNSPASRSRVPYGDSRLQLLLENKIDWGLIEPKVPK